MCELARQDTTGTDLRQRTCGLLTGSAASGSTGAESEGVRTLTNTSILNRIVYADDQTAIIVPQNLPAVMFRAETIGFKASCARFALTPLLSPPSAYSVLSASHISAYVIPPRLMVFTVHLAFQT
jgi:hypothetical protein